MKDKPFAPKIKKNENTLMTFYVCLEAKNKRLIFAYFSKEAYHQ